jgi:hypothetical protein
MGERCLTQILLRLRLPCATLRVHGSCGSRRVRKTFDGLDGIAGLFSSVYLGCGSDPRCAHRLINRNPRCPGSGRSWGIFSASDYLDSAIRTRVRDSGEFGLPRYDFFCFEYAAEFFLLGESGSLYFAKGSYIAGRRPVRRHTCGHDAGQEHCAEGMKRVACRWVTIPNVFQSNSVIHVVDAVVMPN